MKQRNNAWKVGPAAALRGSVDLPGDKSISHRALLVAAVAHGVSRLVNIQGGADCRATLGALEALGVPVRRPGRGVLEVRGRGFEGLAEPGREIDCANSGTTMRLLAGLLAGRPFVTRLAGDASLSRRPMGRVIEPLAAMGARIDARGGSLPPLRVAGGSLEAIDYPLPVASAQVKSAILLAGLQASGRTAVSGPVQTRDHTERMLASFGAAISVSPGTVSVSGGARLSAREIRVPGDFSSAAFFLAAAAIRPGSSVTLPAVGLNPTRTAFLDVLGEMGARVEVLETADFSGEPAGTLRVTGARALRGVRVGGAVIANLIDELPLLAVLGLFAEGVTEVRDAGELRLKESDRIAAMAEALRAIGARIEEKPDGFLLRGPQRPPGGSVRSHGDHRVAMAMAVAGLAADDGVVIEDPGCVAVSFPGFAVAFEGLIEGPAAKK